MVSKKISRILTPVLGIMTFVMVMGVTAAPALAEEIKEEVTTYESSNISKGNDYEIYVNKTVEKDGFKITLEKVTASKKRIKVITIVEFPGKITDSIMNNLLEEMTVKNSDCNFNYAKKKIINDKKLEIEFDGMTFNDLPDSTQLRFDIAVPQYKLNLWVNAQTDLSKNYDKVIEKDISMNSDKLECDYNKFESDILGTIIYGRRNSKDDYYEDEYSSGDSMIFIKCDDKLYELKRQHYFIGHDTMLVNVCNNVTYDDINKAKSVSLIPVLCTLTNKETNDFYDSRAHEMVSLENYDNVLYAKEFKFADGNNGEISKVEREDNKVKVYCNADSEKKSFLMAASLSGNIDNLERYHSKEVQKSIYKNVDEKNSYVVEFSNVNRNDEFSISSDELLSQNNNFEFGEEVKIK